MREIIFKAKRKDNGEWVIGALLQSEDETYIATSFLSGEEGAPFTVAAYEVDPETICQFTGLFDKNGKKIWEGDIVKCNKRKEGYDLYKVVWRKDFADFGVEPIKPKFEARYPIGLSECDTIYGYDYKVIGNIFDNPELLGG